MRAYEMWEQNVLVLLLQFLLGALLFLAIASKSALGILPLLVVPLWAFPLALMGGTIVGMFARASFEGKAKRNYLGRSLYKSPSAMPYLVWAASDLAIAAWVYGWGELAVLVLVASLVGFAGWEVRQYRHADMREPRWFKVLTACPFLGIGALVGGIATCVRAMSRKPHLHMT